MAKNDYSANLRQNIRVYALLRQYILAYCYVIYDMFKTIYNIIIYIYSNPNSKTVKIFYVIFPCDPNDVYLLIFVYFHDFQEGWS